MATTGVSARGSIFHSGPGRLVFGRSRGVIHLVFALVFAVIVEAGSNPFESRGVFALVWPGASIAFLWMLWARPQRYGLVAASTGVIVATVGSSLAAGQLFPSALLFGLASTFQALILVALVRKYIPKDSRNSVRDFFRLGGISVAASSIGGLLAVSAVLLAANEDPLTAFWLWTLRNSVSYAVIGGTCLLAWKALLSKRETNVRASIGSVEYMGLVIVTVVIYVLCFDQSEPLPIVYLAIPANIWAGLRLRPALAAFHGLASGALVVWLNRAGRGPFQDLPEDLATYAAQGYVVLAFAVSIILALHAEERAQLIASLHAARVEEQAASRLREVVIGRMYDGVIVADQQGRLILHNDAGRHFMGAATTRGERLVEHCEFYRPGGGPRLRPEELPLARALDGESVAGVEVDYREHDGSLINLCIDAIPLPGGQGVVVVLHNVTEERRNQQEIGRFASVVAHDLMTPLTVFDGWLEILGSEGMPDTQRHDAVQRLLRSSARMRGMIGGLLDYSLAKNDRIRAEPVDVAAVVQEIVGMRTGKPHQDPSAVVGFQVDVRADVSADPRLFRQVMENLVGNAVKYGPKDGSASVWITSEPHEVPGWTCIRVTDNGIGVPESDREKIFTEFHRSENGTAHAQGTGLGLAICRRIIEGHGGTISVRTPANGGSEFVLTLPISTPQVLEESTKIARTEEAGIVDELPAGELPVVQAQRQEGAGILAGLD